MHLYCSMRSSAGCAFLAVTLLWTRDACADPCSVSLQKLTDNAHLRLVTPLTVKLFGKFELSFDDLDDIVASFVEPIVTRFRDVVDHEKFIEGDKDSVEVGSQSPECPEC